MKLIDRAIELSERIVRRDGDDVTLTQGGQSIPLRALPSKPQALVEDPNQTARLEHDDLAWTIVAVDLGTLGELLPGSTITRPSQCGGASELYEILPQGRDQCARRLDAAGRLLSVRTKRIS